MKNSLKKTLKIFLFLSIGYTLIYWPYIIYDDYVFIEKYWNTQWFVYISGWTVYFLVYYLALSIYFWLIVMAIILVYHKIIKRKNLPYS